MFDAPSRSSVTRRSFLGAVTSGAAAVAGGPSSDAAAATPSRSTRKIRAGTPEETTVHTYDSGVSGPTVFVLGGVHGDEQAGYLAADDIATWTVPAGRLVVVPRANVPAISENKREGLTGDLNRQFPPLQAPSSPLARAIWNEIAVAGADLFLDLHEARTLFTAGGLAQSLGYYPVQNVQDAAGRAIDAVNATISNQSNRFHRRVVPGPLESPSNTLIKRVGLELTAPSYITETYRSQPLADRIAQQKRLVRTLVDQRIRTYTETPRWTEILVRGRGPAVDYEFTVSGRVRKNRRSSVESRDLVLGDQVFGTVTSSEWDRYEYTGTLTAFQLLSGSASDVSVIVGGTTRSLPELALQNAREIRIVSNGTQTDYEFSVSGDIVKSRSLSVNSADIVWDDRVSGTVTDRGDAYRFTGDITGFGVTTDNPSDVTVTVDGSRRSLSSLNPSSTSVIAFEPLGSPVEYQFAVDGSVIKTQRNCNDRIYGRRVFGTVGDKTDRYRYTGGVTALSVTAGSPSDLRITVDGTQRSPSWFPSYPQQ